MVYFIFNALKWLFGAVPLYIRVKTTKFEFLRKRKIGFEHRLVWETRSKITVFDWGEGHDFRFEFSGGMKQSRVREIGGTCMLYSTVYRWNTPYNEKPTTHISSQLHYVRCHWKAFRVLRHTEYVPAFPAFSWLSWRRNGFLFQILSLLSLLQKKLTANVTKITQNGFQSFHCI